MSKDEGRKELLIPLLFSIALRDEYLLSLLFYGSGSGVQRGRVIHPRLHSQHVAELLGAGPSSDLNHRAKLSLVCGAGGEQRRPQRTGEPHLRAGGWARPSPGNPDNQAETDSDPEVVTHC